jgi:glycerophosphoryl diester phosphodiesterase
MLPLITAHAACKGHAPENTLAGIRAAIRLRADSIEVDVRATRDGTPVLLHDATVDRTTDGEGRIDTLSLRQARRLSAGRRTALSSSKGERIPTLRETLQTANGRAVLVLEVKAAGIEEAVLQVVRREGALDWCVVHSFWPQIVERFRKAEPRLACSLLTNGQGVTDWAQFLGFALSLGAQGVSVHHEALTPKLVRAAHLRELRCATWTVNRRVDVRRVAACAVDAITSDFPDRVRRWLPKR